MGAGGLGVGKIRLAASPVLDSLAVMRNVSGWVMGCGLTPAAAPLAPIFLPCFLPTPDSLAAEIEGRYEPLQLHAERVA